MNISDDKSSINMINCGNNIACIVNDNSFAITDYKVLQSQTEDIFIKCMKLLYNGKTQLYFLTDGLKPLKALLKSIDADIFITIISNLLKSIISIKENGFLSCNKIDISPEHIYIDTSTYEVRLLYLPINTNSYEDISSFENKLRISLIGFVQDTPTLYSSKTSKLISDLSDNKLSLEFILSQIKGQRFTKKEQPFSKQNKAYNLKIKAINSPGPFELSVTKSEYVIGKKAELVDGVISFNKLISRSHCKIIRYNDKFAIVDLNSVNGTFVNGIRVQPEQSCPLNNNDVIRLANSEFKVIIE